MHSKVTALDSTISQLNTIREKQTGTTREERARREKASTSSSVSLSFCAHALRSPSTPLNRMKKKKTHPPPGLLRLVAENGGLHREFKALSLSLSLCASQEKPRDETKNREKKTKEEKSFVFFLFSLSCSRFLFSRSDSSTTCLVRFHLLSTLSLLHSSSLINDSYLFLFTPRFF